MKIIVIEPTKTPEIREITDDQDKAYDKLKEILDGYLEALMFTHHTTAFVDEESKIRRDKAPVHNEVATKLIQVFLKRFGRSLIPGDYIANTMVIVGNCNQKGVVDGDMHSVPQNVIDEVLEISQNFVD